MDFPTAWAIARRTAPEYHHNDCSFNTTTGAILCDCDVLTKSPEYVAAYVTPSVLCTRECAPGREDPACPVHGTSPTAARDGGAA